MNELSLKSLNYWNNKNNYINLMQKFIEIWRHDRDNKNLDVVLEEYSILETANVYSFLDLICRLFNECQVFEPNQNLREDYEIGE